MERLRSRRTRRMRWIALTTALLVALVVAVHIAGISILATALTPLVGIALVVLGAFALKARG